MQKCLIINLSLIVLVFICSDTQADVNINDSFFLLDYVENPGYRSSNYQIYRPNTLFDDSSLSLISSENGYIANSVSNLGVSKGLTDQLSRLPASDMSSLRKKNYQLTFGFANQRFSSKRVDRVFLSAEYHNLTNKTDKLAGQIGLVGNRIDYAFRYTFSTSILPSKLSAYVINRDAQFIERTESTNIRSRSNLLGLSWVLKEVQSHDSTFLYSAGYENAKTETLTGDLTNGVQQPLACGASGKCELNVLVIVAKWQHRTEDVKQRFSFSVREGLAITDKSREQRKLNRTQFTKFSSNFELSRVIQKFNGLFRLNSKFQYALDKLNGSERLSLGGLASVRGYRENSLIRDNGLLISSEWIKKTSLTKTYMTAFVDYGVGWNQDSNMKKDKLLSVGAGLAWHSLKSINSELFVGIPLLQRPDEFEKLQDYGVYFSLQYQLL